MAEYSKMASGYFYYNNNTAGVEKIIYLPFLPQLVEVWEVNNWGSPSNNDVFYSWWNPSLPSGSCVNSLFLNSGTSPATLYQTSTSVSSGGITVFSSLNGIVYGTPQQVQASTLGNPTLFTVPSHGYSTGDLVVFESLWQTSTTGMPQLCGIPFVVTVSDANTFSVNWNTNQSNYTALSGSPTGATVKKIINANQYLPNVGFISNISLGQQTVVSLCNNPNFVVGQTVSFRVSSLWGTIQLNEGQNPNIPGFTIYGTVTAISGSQYTVNIDSSNFTSFSSNIAVTQIPGLTFAQMVAVGDVNTAAQTTPNNAQTISGAFYNNTSYGFILGANSVLKSASLSDKIAWRASYFDYFSTPGFL